MDSSGSCSGVAATTETGVRVGILTVSDRASAGVYSDRGGPAVQAALERWLAPGWSPCLQLVADERDRIESALIDMADQRCCAFVVTTGGTGPAARDVTPEVTEAVCDRMLPGFGEAMRAVSLREVPTAILSRQVAGLRGRVLILNLPGSPASIDLCLSVVMPAVPGAVALAGGPSLGLARRA